tara:strand:+ start:1813 stop:3699 length:1887 start_codon:yes stop_codon:yes gene_type:complete
MFVLGTAGHVDHGKSSLVKALTNIDPDRLPEEKARAMTVDLGFADLTLPSGKHVSIVDVPGHEKFIKNMLSGVGSIDLALLIIAADESVMPQTVEHLSILDTLKVTNAIVVITKSDLADADMLTIVKEEISETLAGTSLNESPILNVSSTTLEGIEDLKKQIDVNLELPNKRTGFKSPRLPIDRCFSITGFGTIVTGTLMDGPFHVSQEVEIANSGIKGRIRGLQSHSESVELSDPGVRLAVNISGVSTENINRGDVLTIPGWLHTSKIIDVELSVSKMSPQSLKHNQGITFHSFTSECNGRVRILDNTVLNPGDTGWCQILLETPLPTLKGDSFIVRSSEYTLGGGEILDPSPTRRHKRFDENVINRFITIHLGDPKELILDTLRINGSMTLTEISTQVNASVSDCESELIRMLADDEIVVCDPLIKSQENSILKGFIFAADSWNNLKSQSIAMLTDYHSTFSLRPGIPSQEFRNRLKISPNSLEAICYQMTAENTLVNQNGFLSLPGFKPQLQGESLEEASRYLNSLNTSPFSPPTELTINPEIQSLLLSEGKIIKIAEGLFFHADAYTKMKEQISNYLNQFETITVAEARTLFGSSRKYILPLLEHLDNQKITVRDGDFRRLIKQ